MNVAVGSAFRNCAPNAVRFFERVAKLRDLIAPYPVRVIAVEGDSVDNTRQALHSASLLTGIPMELVTCNHGGPAFGSVETEERFKALSKVGNAIFDGITNRDDVLLYVESDLIWDARTAQQLINLSVNTTGFDVVAPMVMARDLFYDIWGFRGLDGRRFSPFPPFYPGLDKDLFEIGSAGSCLAMRADVATRCRIRNDYCLVGWCDDARSKGYRIAVAPHLKVKQL